MEKEEIVESWYHVGDPEQYSQSGFFSSHHTLKDSMAKDVCGKCPVMRNYSFTLQQSGYEKFHSLQGRREPGCKKERILSNLGMFVARGEWTAYKGWEVEMFKKCPED